MRITVPKWLTNDRLGWGVVVFAAGVLAMVIVGRLQWSARFPGVLPENELRTLGLMFSYSPFIGLQGLPDSVETRIVRADQHMASSSIAGAGLQPDSPIFVYRITGTIKNHDLDGFEFLQHGTIEIILDATTGKHLQGGTLSSADTDSSQNRPDTPLPTLIQISPEKTAEAIP